MKGLCPDCNAEVLVEPEKKGIDTENTFDYIIPPHSDQYSNPCPGAGKSPSRLTSKIHKEPPHRDDGFGGLSGF